VNHPTLRIAIDVCEGRAVAIIDCQGVAVDQISELILQVRERNGGQKRLLLVMTEGTTIKVQSVDGRFTVSQLKKLVDEAAAQAGCQKVYQAPPAVS